MYNGYMWYMGKCTLENVMYHKGAAIKSGAAINGKLPQWYMISCTTPSYGTWENVPWPT